MVGQRLVGGTTPDIAIGRNTPVGEIYGSAWSDLPF